MNYLYNQSLIDPNKDKPAWFNKAVSDSQMRYIELIQSESVEPLPAFTGKTREDAMIWIARYRNARRKEPAKEGEDVAPKQIRKKKAS